MSASGGWGFHLCHPPCPLLYHPCPHSGSSGGCLGFLAFSLLLFVFVTLIFFDVTFVVIVTMFATISTGDSTPEMIVIGHCFPIFSVLLSFQLQHTTTAMVAVRGMTGPFLVIDRFTVEEWRCTGFGFNLTHGTQVTAPFATTLVVVSGTFRPFSLATFRCRGETATQVSLEKCFHMGVILPLQGQFDEQVHKIIVRMGPTLPL